MISEKKLNLIILNCILILGMNWRLEVDVFGGYRAGGLNSNAEKEISVIITFSNKPDLTKFKNEPKRLRRKKIIETLKQNADNSQEHTLQLLSKGNTKKMRKLWLINALAVTAKPEIIEQIKLLPDVEDIILDHPFYLPQTTYSSQSVTDSNNLNAIGAPELWDAGYTGQGITVASMDTGVDVNHPDLANKWRGGPNSWFDAHGEHITPYDTHGHGTQTMGIMVAGVQEITQIPMGVAPDANWIAVKIYNDAFQSDSDAIIAGFQWLANPGGNPDAAPDIVNISWGYPSEPNECFGYSLFGPCIQTLKAAGIAVVCAAGGNTSGQGMPSSISPANYPESFSVGAVNNDNNLLNDSSHGPSACDGSIFPNVVALGMNIPTTDLSFGGFRLYTTLSQSSAAAPHISGAMALLLSAFPNENISQIEWALQKTALDLGAVGPDNYYGYGLINIPGAFELIAVDMNRNLHVDFSDFSLLANRWLESNCTPPDWCGRADTNRDSEVDFSDLLRLSNYWLE